MLMIIYPIKLSWGDGDEYLTTEMEWTFHSVDERDRAIEAIRAAVLAVREERRKREHEEALRHFESQGLPLPATASDQPDRPKARRRAPRTRA